MYMVSDLPLIISVLSRMEEIRHWPPILLPFLSFLQLFSLSINFFLGVPFSYSEQAFIRIRMVHLMSECNLELHGDQVQGCYFIL